MEKEGKNKEAKERKGKKGKSKGTRPALKSFVLWGGVLVLIGWGILRAVEYFNSPFGVPENSVEVAQDEWIKGNPEATLTIVEYGDFQCPACGTYHPILSALNEEFSNEVRFVYRHLPLTQIHPNAYPAALAAEAAGVQGMFWEMHNMLFENQPLWSSLDSVEEVFVEMARELGLDEEQFRVDMAASEVKERVDEDIATAGEFGLNSTPSFLFNGLLISNPNGYDAFKNLIESALSSLE